MTALCIERNLYFCTLEFMQNEIKRLSHFHSFVAVVIVFSHVSLVRISHILLSNFITEKFLLLNIFFSETSEEYFLPHMSFSFLCNKYFT